MLAGVRRARGRPRPPGQEGPAGLPALARRAAGRARLGQPVRAAAGPAGTSSAPRSPATTSAPTFDVQGGGSDLVFPHHEMCAAEAQVADPGRRSPGPTCTPGWSGSTARRCRSPRATWSSSPRCATATSTRWRSGWRCCGTTTAATGSGPTPSSGRRSTTLDQWRRARRTRRRRAGRPGRRRGARRAGRRPRRPARGRRGRPLGRRHTRHRRSGRHQRPGRRRTMLGVLDAALGLRSSRWSPSQLLPVVTGAVAQRASPLAASRSPTPR